MKKEKTIKHSSLREKLLEYSRKVGRASARPVLLMYQVMKSPKTPKGDKLLIFAALSYLLLPMDIIAPSRLVRRDILANRSLPKSLQVYHPGNRIQG